MESTKRGQRRMQRNLPLKFLRWRLFRSYHLLFWLAVLLALSFPTSGRAAVRFDMFTGYDGIVPQGSWFPIAFEVQNDGPPFIAVVEVSPAQFSSTQTRTMVVELPTGTTKRGVCPDKQVFPQTSTIPTTA